MQAVPVPNPPHSRCALICEALFPVAAVQAYMWSVPHVRPRWLDVLAAGLILAITVGYTLRRKLRGWRVFGLARGPDHKRAAFPIAVLTVGAVGGLLLAGWLTTGHKHGGLRQNWDILRALAAYPVWGFVQQGIMFGVAYPRFRLVCGERAAPYLTAGLFALAHLPNPLLTGGGFALALGYGLVWRRHPSLPVIGISHGVIGAVCDKALHVSMRVGAHYFGA